MLLLLNHVALLPDFGRKVIDFSTAVLNNCLEFLDLTRGNLEVILGFFEAELKIGKIMAGLEKRGVQPGTLFFGLTQLIKTGLQQLKFAHPLVEGGANVMHFVAGIVQFCLQGGF